MFRFSEIVTIINDRVLTVVFFVFSGGHLEPDETVKVPLLVDIAIDINYKNKVRKTNN